MIFRSQKRTIEVVLCHTVDQDDEGCSRLIKIRILKEVRKHLVARVHRELVGIAIEGQQLQSALILQQIFYSLRDFDIGVSRTYVPNGMSQMFYDLVSTLFHFRR